MGEPPRLRVARVPLASLKVDVENVRDHGPRDLGLTNQSLGRFGQVQFLVVQESTLQVIDGNARVDLLRKAGETHADVILLDVDDVQARALQVVLHRAPELATWNVQRLEATLAFLAEADYDVELLLGFTPDDLHELVEQAAAEAGELEDELPPDRTEGPAVTRLGDVWVFPSGHRLVCGDATDPSVVRVAMGGQMADLVHTDPPYGVSYEADGWAPIENDDLEGQQLEAFLTRAFQAAAEHARPEAAWYVWHASSTRDEFKRALTAAGLRERQPIVWVKPGATLGRADYQYQHEPCMYAVKDGETPDWYGGRDETTAWTIARATRDGTAVLLGKGIRIDAEGESVYMQPKTPAGRHRVLQLRDGGAVRLTGAAVSSDVWLINREPRPVHPTQKPLEVPARAMRNSTRPGAVVLDPFAGSGSTLIAAEHLHRRCVAVELSSHNCDVILQWYHRLTGKRATNQRGEESPIE